MADNVIKETSPEKVDLKAANPADQADSDFWGPLADLSKFFWDLPGHLLTFSDLTLRTHILIGALLFPRFFSASGDRQEGPSNTYRIWCFVVGPIILLLNLAAIFAVVDCFILAVSPPLVSIYDWIILHKPNQVAESLQLMLSQGGLLQFAKALFVLVAWVLSLVALIIVNNEKMIDALLCAVEDEVTQTRDESVMLIRAGQAGLRSLNAKVYGEEQPNPMLSASELIKSIGPLALLFLNKERNFLRWGMAGAKVATKGIRFIQNLMKQK